MPINIPYNNSTVHNFGGRRSLNDDPVKPHTRKYNVKKISAVDEHHDNQNNRWHEDRYSSYRSRPLATTDYNDTRSRYRYKSYDYLPMRYHSDRFTSPRYTSTDVRNDFSDSADNYDDYKRDQTRFTRPYVPRHYSSNEELDNSHTNDYSSDTSRRYPYRSSNQNYGDFIKDTSRRPYGNYKFPYESRNYESLYNDNSYEPTYNHGSYYNPVQRRSKHASFSTNYANNNRSDINSLLSSRLHSDDVTKYSRQRGDVNNIDPITLKSTRRQDEDVPHSGTKLDKFSGNHWKSYSTNSDLVGQYNTRTPGKPSKMNRCTLPPSPKHSNVRKVGVSGKNSHDNYRSKNSTPQRVHYDSYHGDRRANESCYFENCHNSNNDYPTKQQHRRSDSRTDTAGSPSDTDISFTDPLRNDKPKDDYLFPFISEKPIANSKSINPSIKTESTSTINHSPIKDHIKEPLIGHQKYGRSSRHRSSHKRN